MRIAFMGKGGSGKTTISTSFTKYLSKKDKNIFFFDVDLNSHTLKEFGLKDNELSALSMDFEEVIEILEPGFLKKHNFEDLPKFGTIPVNEKSNFILPNKNGNKFVEKYGIKKGNTTFFMAGSHNNSEKIENACYHSVLNSFELAIHRIIDTKDSFIISDTTAGVDNIGTSLYMAYDLVVFIVEPTERSIQVYNDYVKLDEVDSDYVYVIGNKIEDDEDIDFIKNNISENKILGYVNNDKNIYRDSSLYNYEKFIVNNYGIFEIILEKLNSQEKDWSKYYKKVYELFVKETRLWWNPFLKTNFEKLLPENYEFLNKLPFKK